MNTESSLKTLNKSTPLTHLFPCRPFVLGFPVISRPQPPPSRNAAREKKAKSNL